MDINHICFIMDGNRRFSKKSNISEVDGYINGTNHAFKLCRFLAKNYRVNYISLWAFSKNNKKRDLGSLEEAIKDLYLTDFIMDFECIFIGDINDLSINFREAIDRVRIKNSEVKKYKYSTKILIFVNYSGSFDIEYSANNCRNFDKITFKDLYDNSYVSSIPDIDIIIRTGNKNRLSDFSFFLTLFSEIYFSKKMWNEFSVTDLKKILIHYFSNRCCSYGA